MFYNNPASILAATLVYLLVTSQWNLNFSVSSRGPACSDAATQTESNKADKETETERNPDNKPRETRPKGAKPNKQLEPKTVSHTEEPELSQEPETLEEAKRRLHETLTYEDLFEPKTGLGPAAATFSATAASSSTSTTRSSGGRAEARLSLSVQRSGFLECAESCLSEAELSPSVWVTKFGYAYHRKRCSNLKHAREIHSETVREAIRSGKAACNQCCADHWIPTVKARFPGNLCCEECSQHFHRKHWLLGGVSATANGHP